MRKGFEQDGRKILPCSTSYHLGCIVVREPFQTWLPGNKGLSFPKVAISLNFVCEACTVQAVLGCELMGTPRDRALLMLEQMRMINQASSWDPKTLVGYQAHHQ